MSVSMVRLQATNIKGNDSALVGETLGKNLFTIVVPMIRHYQPKIMSWAGELTTIKGGPIIVHYITSKC